MKGIVFGDSGIGWFVGQGEDILPIYTDGRDLNDLVGTEVEFNIGVEYEGEPVYPRYAVICKDKKTLYSEIEYLVIRWNLDGTRTAGDLTREILKIIGK